MSGIDVTICQRGRLRIGGGRVFSSVLALICCGAMSAAASAASLKVSVTPKSVHKGRPMQITITGAYRRNELKGKPFLVSFFQFNKKPCKADAGKEYSSYGPPYFHSTVSRSPFKHADKFSHGVREPGPVRVCAYLYAQVIMPLSPVKPLVTATKQFTVLR